mmetsp:Transcript_26791/g.25824  ORF Transcript_26791/g.25824 Transcript_26791/m.25824 type:complete len:112 (+) Transcript_26791:877-1212(+)
MNLSISNSKTPKDNLQKKHTYTNSHHIHQVAKSEDRLNLSVEISAPKVVGKHTQDTSFKLSKIQEEKLSNSMQDVLEKNSDLDTSNISGVNGANDESFFPEKKGSDEEQQS